MAHLVAFLKGDGSTSISYTCYRPSAISLHFKSCWLDWEYLLPPVPPYFCAVAVAFHFPFIPFRRNRANKTRQGTGPGHRRVSYSLFPKLRALQHFPENSPSAREGREGREMEKNSLETGLWVSSSPCVWGSCLIGAVSSGEGHSQLIASPQHSNLKINTPTLFSHLSVTPVGQTHLNAGNEGASLCNLNCEFRECDEKG